MSNSVLKVLILAFIAAAIIGVCAVCILVSGEKTPSHNGAYFLRAGGTSYGQKK